MARAAKAIDAFNSNGGTSGAFDLGAHLIKAGSQIGHFRLAGGHFR